MRVRRYALAFVVAALIGSLFGVGRGAAATERVVQPGDAIELLAAEGISGVVDGVSNCGTVGCDVWPGSVGEIDGWSIRAKAGLFSPLASTHSKVSEELWVEATYGGDAPVNARLTGKVHWAGALAAMGVGEVWSQVTIVSFFWDRNPAPGDPALTKQVIHQNRCDAGLALDPMPGVCLDHDTGDGLVSLQATLKPGHVYRVGLQLTAETNGKGVPTNPVIPGTFDEILWADFMDPGRTTYAKPGLSGSDMWLHVDPDLQTQVAELQGQVLALQDQIRTLSDTAVRQGEAYYGNRSTAFITSSGYALEAITGAPDAAALGAWSTNNALGVWGHVTGGGGVGVKGEAEGKGTGVHATSPAGNALRVDGKTSLSRSGRATVLKGKSYTDITVPGGLTSRSMVHATLQTYRAGVSIAAVRINYPSTGKARIYLTKVASTTSTTYVGWFVAEY